MYMGSPNVFKMNIHYMQPVFFKFYISMAWWWSKWPKHVANNGLINIVVFNPRHIFIIVFKRLICLILICPQTFTVLVTRYTASFWLRACACLLSRTCLRIPVLRHPVVTSEIHSHLQNSESTVFLFYHHDYMQHTTSPILIKPTLKTAQPFHATWHMAFLLTDKRRTNT